MAAQKWRCRLASLDRHHPLLLSSTRIAAYAHDHCVGGGGRCCHDAQRHATGESISPSHLYIHTHTLHQLNLKSDAFLLRIIITLLRILAAAVQRGVDARPQALLEKRPFLRCEGAAIIFTNWFYLLNAALCRHCCCSRRWLAIHPCTCATDGLPTRGGQRRCCCLHQ